MNSSTMNNLTSAVPSNDGVPVASKVIVIVIGFLSVLFNGLLLIVMTVNAKQVFASLGSYFIANLAIADFLTGINSVIWGIYQFVDFNQAVANVLLRVFWAAVQVSFYTIFVMSTERLIAIVFPFRAALVMSKKKTILYCFLVWFIAIVLSACNQGNMNEIDRFWFGLIVVFEVLIIIIVIEYVFVFRQLRALWLQSRTRIVYNNNGAGSETTTICNKTNASHSNQRQAKDVQREYQATIVVICLAVGLVLTVVPYTIATQTYIWCTILLKSSCKTETADNVYVFMWYYFPIELLNFVLNPVVYAWRLPKYRNAFLTTFRLKKRTRRGQSYMANKTQDSMLSRGASTRAMLS